MQLDVGCAVAGRRVLAACCGRSGGAVVQAHSCTCTWYGLMHVYLVQCIALRMVVRCRGGIA